MIALIASGITIGRGGHTILENVSLRAQAGEFIAVIGPNGAGKSTLLTILAGLVLPDSGHVLLDDKSLTALARRDLAKRRAYLPQNPRCEWPISAERLVALGLTPTLPAFGDFPAAMQAQVESVLADCDLLGHRDQPATTLSGGELARAMLARALVGNPEILIVDEPTAGLDPRHALDAMRRLSALARGGKLVVAALHDLTMAARHATRIVALHEARIAADGPPESALSADLLRRIFGVDAHIGQTQEGPFVDYRSHSETEIAP